MSAPATWSPSLLSLSLFSGRLSFSGSSLQRERSQAVIALLQRCREESERVGKRESADVARECVATGITRVRGGGRWKGKGEEGISLMVEG